MTTILLTRPTDDSSDVAMKLAQRQYESIIEPLLTILPTHLPPPEVAKLQAVMLTSAHALDFIEPQSDLLKRACFCVGSRTASAARAFGFSNVHDATGDGLALAHYILQKLSPSTGDILHICGQDTDSRGRDELERQEFTVRIWATYRAEAAQSLSGATLQALRSGKIDAVLLFSTRTAETLARLLAQHGLEACCERMIALGISDRVRMALATLPWHCLESAPLPSEESVVQRLSELLPVSEVS